VTDERSSRVVVVTGVSRGIGLELTRQLAGRGADLPDGGPAGGSYRDGRPVPW
jgi:NADP-dependent 3-hydroxy acid dehydrogenase YdfG